MFLFRKIAPPAALLVATLLATPAFAADNAAKNDAKVPVKEQAKEQPKTSPTDVLVRVNGTAITRLEVERAVKVMLAQNQGAPTGPEFMKQARERAAEQLTAAEILYQAALKVEVKDLEKQIDAKIAKGRSNFDSDAAYEAALKEVDMTPKDARDFARKEIIINNFIEERFASNASPSDEEAQTFYFENVYKYFKKPETARASHILIAADDKTLPDDRRKAREKAEAILERLRKGEDFAAIAKAESSCPSGAKGGDLGEFERGQMVPPFDQAAFALKPGQISEIVETQYGYHVIKLVEKHEGTTDKFEDVKGKIKDFLKREKVQKDVIAFIDNQKKNAKIEKPIQPGATPSPSMGG